MRNSKVLRIALSFILLPSGLVLVLLKLDTNLGLVTSNLGFALIVTAIVNLFHELFISKLEVEDMSRILSNDIINKIERKNHENKGLILASQVRRGYRGYYEWVTADGPLNIFIAGRSVLHRIQADLDALKWGKIEDIIINKLKDKSIIKILLIDPRSNLIERLAREEGRQPEHFYANLQESFRTINKIYTIIKEYKIQHCAEFSIRLYDKIPYFAYHKVNAKVIVGFYFASSITPNSSAYEVTDEYTMEQFEKHFYSIFENSIPLIEASTKHLHTFFNHTEFKEIETYIENKVKQLALG